MKKINQPTTEGEVIIPPLALEKSIRFLDLNEKRRYELLETTKRLKRSVRDYKNEITKYSKIIRDFMNKIKLSTTELENLGESSTTIETVREQINSIGKLQWVSKVTLSEDGTSILLKTRPGILKTVFHKRIVYKDGARIEELLTSPLVLPLPNYEIIVQLAALGGSFDRNNSLSVRLIDTDVLKFMPDPNQLGWVMSANAHWASGESSFTLGMNGVEGKWGALCLRDYASDLQESGKKGIIDLLNDTVMFLQNAGWANAYRPKLQWAVTLGFQPYYDNLVRPLLDSETFEQIKTSTRERLSKYLEENNMTEHMYYFGADAENSTQRNQIEDTFNRMIYRDLVHANYNIGVDEIQP